MYQVLSAKTHTWATQCMMPSVGPGGARGDEGDTLGRGLRGVRVRSIECLLLHGVSMLGLEDRVYS